MASSITFTGLGSGLDTNSIVSQLMTVEQQPQDRLKTQLATEQTKLSSLQGLNTALASLQQSADSFSTGSTWTQLTATSSSSAVKVSASSSAAATTISLGVTAVATAAQNTFTTAAKLTDVVTSATSLDVMLSDGTTASVPLADGKLSTVISSLNGLKSATGTPLVSASAINDGAGNYRLVVNQLATGAGSLTVTEAGGGALLGGPDAAISKAGQDATVTAGGMTLTQRSNTFTALMPGVDVTITPAAQGTTATLSISDDGASRANALSTFVSQVNQVIDQISAATAYGVITAGAAAKGGGALAGDMTLRAISTQLLNTIFPGGNTSMARMGLDLDSNGHLTFNQSKFQTAYQADPQGVQAAFTGDNGFASRVSAIAKMQSDSTTGALTQRIQSENDQIKQYNDEIADWDDRLAAKQAALTQQYTALNTLLSKLQTQSSWLTTQLDSMTSSHNDN